VIRPEMICEVSQKWTNKPVREFYSPHCRVESVSASGATAWVKFFWTRFPPEISPRQDRVFAIATYYLRPLSPLEQLATCAE